MHGMFGCGPACLCRELGGGPAACVVQGPVGVSNKHVETAIDEASGKLTMLYQVKDPLH